MEVREEALTRGLRDIADGILVIYASCCRPQDIECLTELDLESLEDPERAAVLWARRKASAADLVQRGDSTANPICMPLAVTVLVERVAAARRRTGDPGALLFPEWNDIACSRLIHDLAKNWPTKVRWTGPHNGRCGAARDTLDQALVKVLDSGRCDAKLSATRLRGPSLRRSAIRTGGRRPHHPSGTPVCCRGPAAD